MRARSILILLLVFASMVVFSNAGIAQTSLTIGTKKTVNLGETFSVTLNVGNVTNLAGFQMDLAFSPAILEAVTVVQGTFLTNAFCVDPKIDNTAGLISKIACARTAKDGINGSGILATITFKAIGTGQSFLRIQNSKLSDPTTKVIAASTSENSVNVIKYPRWDVNQDGRVDVLDLVIAGQKFGESITTPSIPNPDVNDDGKVDISDLALIAQHFGEGY